jgi:hypothetical protein
MQSKVKDLGVCHQHPLFRNYQHHLRFKLPSFQPLNVLCEKINKGSSLLHDGSQYPQTSSRVFFCIHLNTKGVAKRSVSHIEFFDTTFIKK